MKLHTGFDRILGVSVIVALGLLFGVGYNALSRNTYAQAETESDSAIYDTEGAKFVTFHDGGEKLIMKTDAKTVGEALSRAEIVINEGDKVEPALEAEINADNFFINVYRARPVVVKDGVNKKYLMTASYDAKEIAKDAGVTVYDGDEVGLVLNDDFLDAGVASIYEVTRNGGRTLTEEVEIPFAEETVRDVNLEKGKSEVRQLGEVGMKRVYYNVQYMNNEEVSREMVSEEVVREAVSRVVAVGAKPAMRPNSEVCAGWAREAGVSEADLAAAIDLIYHESGCRVDAQNPSGAYGIPQALPGAKMAAAGADWETNPVTQIRWMAGYVNRYGGWQGAIEFWYAHGWY